MAREDGRVTELMWMVDEFCKCQFGVGYTQGYIEHDDDEDTEWRVRQKELQAESVAAREAITTTVTALAAERDALEFQGQVKTFHKRMGLPCPDWPTVLTSDQVELRIRLISEETDEFVEAAVRDDFYSMIDALVDLLYVTLGSAVEMGVNLAPFFAEVHRANMEKIPPGDSGKCIKPEGWRAPDIEAVYAAVYRGDRAKDRPTTFTPTPAAPLPQEEATDGK